jgi:hypothetical protein
MRRSSIRSLMHGGADGCHGNHHGSCGHRNPKHPQDGGASTLRSIRAFRPVEHHPLGSREDPLAIRLVRRGVFPENLSQELVATLALTHRDHPDPSAAWTSTASARLKLDL